MKRINQVREALKSKGLTPGQDFDAICQRAMDKMMASTDWAHREFTKEEILNAIRALREHYRLN